MEPGDLVYLKSGGNQMTVLSKSQERGQPPVYRCAWIDQSGTMHCHEIPEAGLMTKEDALKENKP